MSKTFENKHVSKHFQQDFARLERKMVARKKLNKSASLAQD